MRLFTVTFGPAQSQVLGIPMGMRITITPSVSVTWAPTGTPLPAYEEDVSALDGLQGQLTLPHPDQDGFIDGNGNTIRNWTYTANVRYTAGAKAKLVATKVFTHYASEPDTIDLDNIIPVPSTYAGAKIAVSFPTSAVIIEDDLVLYDIAGNIFFQGNVRGPAGTAAYDGGVIY